MISNLVLALLTFVLMIKFGNLVRKKQKLIKIIAKLKFAYLNKDEPSHQFEIIALKQADEIIDKNGGMEKLLKD